MAQNMMRKLVSKKQIAKTVNDGLLSGDVSIPVLQSHELYDGAHNRVITLTDGQKTFIDNCNLVYVQLFDEDNEHHFMGIIDTYSSIFSVVECGDDLTYVSTHICVYNSGTIEITDEVTFTDVDVDLIKIN